MLSEQRAAVRETSVIKCVHIGGRFATALEVLQACHQEPRVVIFEILDAMFLNASDHVHTATQPTHQFLSEADVRH